MQPTQYPIINALLEDLLLALKNTLGEKLAGLYLEGSLVVGDFEESISDIDLVAALASDVTETEFAKLKEMHDEFVQVYPEWNDRIEVCYITLDALKHIKTTTATIINISPGEPFHRRQSSREWIMNWYLTREKSIPLFGPDPKSIIETLTKEDFLQSVKDHAALWSDWVGHMRDRNGQAAYLILTLCRALYAYATGDQVSKKQAALWVKETYPDWSPLVDQALVWRATGNSERVNDEKYQYILQFVQFTKNTILNSRR